MRPTRPISGGRARAGSATLRSTLLSTSILVVAGLIPHGQALAAALKSVRIGVSGDATRVVFDLVGAPQYDAAISSERELIVRLKGASPGGVRVAEPSGLVAAARGESTADGAAFHFPLHDGAQIKSVFVLPPGGGNADHRLVVDLAPAPAALFAARSIGEPAARFSPAAPGLSAFDAQAAHTGCAPIRLDKTPAKEPERSALDRFACPAQPLIDRLTANFAQVQFPEQRLTLTQTHQLGPDVVWPQKHVYAGSLDATKSWRSEIDAAYSLIDDGDMTLAATFGLFENQMPIPSMRGGVGTDRFATWRGNAVADAAVTFTGFEGRLSLTSGVAMSETTLRQRIEDEPWLWIFEPHRIADRSDQAGANFQKFVAKVFDSPDFKAAVELAHTSTGDDFRSFQSNTPVYLLYEGETLDLKTKLQAGKLKFEYGKEVHSGPYFSYDRNNFRVSRGAVTVKGGFETQSTAFDGIVFSNDRTIRGKASFDLNTILGSDAPKFLPDEVNVGYTERSALEATAFNSADAVRRTVGLGASKSGDHFQTDIYAYWIARNDFTDAFDFAASTMFGVDFTQSFFGDDWDFSIYANMSDMNRTRDFVDFGRERSLSGGVSFKKEFEKIPDIRFSFDAFQYATDYFRDDYIFRNHDLSLKLEADLSEMLFTGYHYIVDEERPLSVYLAAYRGWSIFEDSFGPPSDDSETRVLLLLRRSRLP
jgi:hypothetical protein